MSFLIVFVSDARGNRIERKRTMETEKGKPYYTYGLAVISTVTVTQYVGVYIVQ